MLDEQSSQAQNALHTPSGVLNFHQALPDEEQLYPRQLL